MPRADANNQAQAGDPAGPEQWLRSLPIITQYWFATTVVLTAAGNLGIISPFYYLYSWPNIKAKFEIWRLVTPFCYAGKFDFNTLICVYLLVQFSQQYEKGGCFNTGAGGGTADYAFALLFAMVGTILTFPIVNMVAFVPPLFCRNLVFFVMYLWSKRDPRAHANIWGIPIQALYLPFAYLILSVCLGNSIADMVHGMCVGHIYYFLADVVPAVYGNDILHTPRFLIDYFGVGQYQPEVPLRPNRMRDGWGQEAQQQPQGGHNWGGGGRVLGGN